MRIISGKYRGKKLKEFELSSTRPTQDRVKESIFNLIQFDIADAVVLDLFAGTGALGIEAISRGAKSVVLVDINPTAINLIKENLKTIQGDYQIVNQDYMAYLRKNQKFDIVLLDPPYDTDFGYQAIQYIFKNDLLNENGIIIFETKQDNEIDTSNLNADIAIKQYGIAKVYKITKR